MAANAAPLRQHTPPSGPLLADAKSLNNVFVALGVVFLEVVQQAAPLAHHHEKTAPGRARYCSMPVFFCVHTNTMPGALLLSSCLLWNCSRVRRTHQHVKLSNP